MKKLLFVGDAGCPSGFAVATHNILNVLREQYDVTVLGINYRGDPHGFPYPIYAAAPGGDGGGVGRLIWMCDLVKPDVIVLQNDPWNIPFYTQLLKRFDEYKTIPIVGAVAVDGKNCMGKQLNDLDLAIFWTTFGEREAREGGYKNTSMVIPLGVDQTLYYPTDKREARQRLGLTGLEDAYIVGNVNRNQPRKRWDLTLRYFAQWVKDYWRDDAYLYLHVAPTGDTGIQVKALADYYEITPKLILMEPATHYGIDEGDMRETYNSFDVQISTTQGEGFGLTTLEGMACGVPQIVPDWAALGEITKGAAILIPCTSTAVGPPYVNVIGGVPDEQQFIMALETLHLYPEYRARKAKAALERSDEARFSWKTIGQQWTAALASVLVTEEVSV